jgi:hypothetical protein
MEPIMATMTKTDWDAFAQKCAEDAHENHFPSRRGVWHFEDLDVLVFYNNNPYAKFPNARDEETAEFRAALKARGIEELAYAAYPPPEDDHPGYTYAMVVNASRDREDELAAVMHDILGRSHARMWAEK